MRILPWGPDTGNPTVIGCHFNLNATAGQGGAVLGVGVRIENCHFSNNYARRSGGAMFLQDGSAVTGCTFSNNESPDSGGAIWLQGKDNLLAGCTFRGNMADSGGGVVAVGSNVIVGCTFEANTADLGGGLRIGSGFSELVNCLFIGNRATKSGGVLDTTGSVDMQLCTAVGNYASQGGFFSTNTGPLKRPLFINLNSSIFTNNRGGEIWNPQGNITILYSNSWFVDPNEYYDPNQGIVWGPGNLSVDPYFADPGYWDPRVITRENDPSDDFFVAGDYHVKSQAGRWDQSGDKWVLDDVTSVCIDAGDPNIAIGDEPLPHGDRVNMGVYGGTDAASKSKIEE